MSGLGKTLKLLIVFLKLKKPNKKQTENPNKKCTVKQKKSTLKSETFCFSGSSELLSTEKVTGDDSLLLQSMWDDQKVAEFWSSSITLIAGLLFQSMQDNCVHFLCVRWKKEVWCILLFSFSLRNHLSVVYLQCPYCNMPKKSFLHRLADNHFATSQCWVTSVGATVGYHCQSTVVNRASEVKQHESSLHRRTLLEVPQTSFNCLLCPVWVLKLFILIISTRFLLAFLPLIHRSDWWIGADVAPMEQIGFLF